MKPIIILNIFILLTYGQQIEINPSDQFVREYSDVLLECKVSGYNSEEDLIEWCKNDFCTWGRLSGNDSDEYLQYKSLPKYYIVGNRHEGEWNLLIKNVTDRELGDYKCTLIRKSTQNFEKIQSKSAALKLMKKPGLIEFDNSRALEVVLDQVQHFDCIVHEGVPQPEFKWKLVDSENNFTYLSDAQIIRQNLRNTIVYTSRISILGSFEHMNKKLVCEVEHPMLEVQRNNNPMLSRSVDINFKYKPQLELRISPDGALFEKETYIFSCISSAKPETNRSIIKLIDENSQIYNHYTSIESELAIKMDRYMNGLVILCESENSIGTTIINQTLNVTYEPRFQVELPKIITLNSTTKSVNLECLVDSNPPAKIIWLNDQKDIINTGNSIDINISQLGDYSRSYSNIYGQFTCRASLIGYQEIESSTVFIRNGLPSITGKSIYLAEPEKNLLVKFSVLSSPKFDENAVCTKLDIKQDISLRQIFSSAKRLKRYEFNEHFADGTNISSDISFEIRSVSEDDFGVYNCTVGNSYGQNSFIFEIQPKPNDNKFIIALSTSILFLVLFLALILTIFIIMFHIRLKERRLKKKSLNYDYSNSTKNSPNLSVSEWITNNSLTDTKQEEKNPQSKTLFDGKTIDTFESNLDSILIYPTRQSNQSSLNSEQQLINNNDASLMEVRSEPLQGYNQNDLNKFYQDMSIFSLANYQSPSVILSKFQTNV